MSLNSDQLGRLLDNHAGALVLYARQLCDDPEDAVQQAFMKLTTENPTPQSPLAWLYKVVRNEALAASRATNRRRRREQEVKQSQKSWFEPREGEAVDTQTAAAALAALPQDQRELVTAHLWGGLTFREIGEIVGLSDSAAHRPLSRSARSTP